MSEDTVTYYKNYKKPALAVFSSLILGILGVLGTRYAASEGDVIGIIALAPVAVLFGGGSLVFLFLMIAEVLTKRGPDLIIGPEGIIFTSRPDLKIDWQKIKEIQFILDRGRCSCINVIPKDFLKGYFLHDKRQNPLLRFLYLQIKSPEDLPLSIDPYIFPQLEEIKSQITRYGEKFGLKLVEVTADYQEDPSLRPVLNSCISVFALSFLLILLVKIVGPEKAPGILDSIKYLLFILVLLVAIKLKAFRGSCVEVVFGTILGLITTLILILTLTASGFW